MHAPGGARGGVCGRRPRRGPPLADARVRTTEAQTIADRDGDNRIDVVDNRDGTLSLFGTVLDHAAAPNPGGGDVELLVRAPY